MLTRSRKEEEDHHDDKDEDEEDDKEAEVKGKDDGNESTDSEMGAVGGKVDMNDEKEGASGVEGLSVDVNVNQIGDGAVRVGEIYLPPGAAPVGVEEEKNEDYDNLVSAMKMEGKHLFEWSGACCLSVDYIDDEENAQVQRLKNASNLMEHLVRSMKVRRLRAQQEVMAAKEDKRIHRLQAGQAFSNYEKLLHKMDEVRYEAKILHKKAEWKEMESESSAVQTLALMMGDMTSGMKDSGALLADLDQRLRMLEECAEKFGDMVEGIPAMSWWDEVLEDGRDHRRAMHEEADRLLMRQQEAQLQRFQRRRGN